MRQRYVLPVVKKTLRGPVNLSFFLVLFLVSTLPVWITPAVLARTFSGKERAARPPAAFLYRPYSGSQPFLSRVTSYFDHDEPWYAADGVFVRYDGKRWNGANSSVLNCQGGLNCYDGHDGYDLNLWFEPVLSASAGKVSHAGWYNPLNHSAAYGLWVAINHGNGFATVYGHLSVITVAMNEHVDAQWQIGTSGTTGSSTGPHLHFGTFYAASWRATDPSGWSSKSTDPNIVSDSALLRNDSTDIPVPVLSSKGKSVYPGAIMVDDGSAGWSSTGKWQTAQSASDIGGKLHWVETTGKSATASATWQPQLSVDGYYEVGVFIDDNHASSSWASYTISSADPDTPDKLVLHKVEVDQAHIGLFQSPFGTVNTHAQWVSLGVYYFSSAHPGSVVLRNNTGESGQQLAADGIEFVPLTATLQVAGSSNGSHGFLR